MSEVKMIEKISLFKACLEHDLTLHGLSFSPYGKVYGQVPRHWCACVCVRARVKVRRSLLLISVMANEGLSGNLDLQQENKIVTTTYINERKIQLQYMNIIVMASVVSFFKLLSAAFRITVWVVSFTVK